MATVAQGLELIDRIARPSSVPDHWQPIMREAFVREVGRETGEASVGDLLAGLSWAVQRGLWGLRLDYTESHVLLAQATAFIEARVGIPENADHQAFTFDESSVAAGLQALDGWLLNDHERHGSGDQLRLVEVNTGSDYYLAIAHPEAEIDDLIRHLASLGVTGTRVRAPVENPARMQNQAKQFVARLQEVHGYVPSGEPSTETSAYFVRFIDDQNAVTVIVDSRSLREPDHQPGRVALRFALARRDLNEHYVRWLPMEYQPANWWSPTVFETPQFFFFAAAPVRWGAELPFSEYQDEADVLIEELASHGTLEKIETQLFREQDKVRYIWRRIVTDTLSGREDRSAADFQHLRETAAAKPVGDSFRDRFETFDAHVQAFRAEHPNGIR